MRSCTLGACWFGQVLLDCLWWISAVNLFYVWMTEQKGGEMLCGLFRGQCSGAIFGCSLWQENLVLLYLTLTFPLFVSPCTLCFPISLLSPPVFFATGRLGETDMSRERSQCCIPMWNEVWDSCERWGFKRSGNDGFCCCMPPFLKALVCT